MSESKSNKLWLIVAGVGAVVAGAVIYHYLTGEEEEGNSGKQTQKEEESLKRDLTKLDKVNKEANGMIKINDFISLFKLVTKHAKSRITSVK
jgi:hypothetical protein